MTNVVVSNLGIYYTCTCTFYGDISLLSIVILAFLLIFTFSLMARVLNVLHHWVKDHYYDFQQDPSVLEQLKEFVGTVKAKNMQKWIASIHRALSKVSGDIMFTRDIMLSLSLPPPPL